MSHKIAWTDETWNPIVGCSHAAYTHDGAKAAHPGCTHCYAERTCSRLLPGFEQIHNVAAVGGHWTGKVVINPARLLKPFEWRTGRRIFVCSLSDLWHPAVSHADRVLIHAVMLCCVQHTFQDLTKRPDVAAKWLEANSPASVLAQAQTDPRWVDRPVPLLPYQWQGVYHVHRYVSVSDQATADSLIPLLLEMPAAVRGISLEPMLGPVNLAFSAFNGADSFGQMPGIDHVIVGGESGRNARPFALEWALDIIDQCRRARVPCFVKQMGSKPYVEDPDFWPEFFSDDDGWYITGQGGNSWSKWVRMKGSGSDPAEWPEELRVRQHVLRQSVRAL